MAWEALKRFEPWGEQRNFCFDQSRFVCAAAGVRSGKTIGGAWKSLTRMLKDAGRRRGRGHAVYKIGAPTYKLTRPAKRALLEHLDRSQVDTIAMGDKRLGLDGSAPGGILHLRGGIEIEFVSTHNPDSLVGENVSGIWLDEAAQMHANVLAEVRQRLANTGGWLIATTSPRAGSPMHRQWVEPFRRGELQDFGLYEWWSEHSPYIPAEVVEDARRTLPPHWFARDWQASWESFKGQVYPHFDGEVHCVRQPIVSPTGYRTYDRVVIGVDLNVAEDAPASFVVMRVQTDGRTTATGRVVQTAHIAEEYYRHGVGLDVEGYARTIVQTCERQGPVPVDIYIDPSAKLLRKRVAELLSPMSGHAVHAAKNDVADGIRCVAAALHHAEDYPPLLTVDPDLTHWLAEVKSYRWEQDAQGRSLDRPHKVDDHAMDATRYACMGIWGTGWLKQLR